VTGTIELVRSFTILDCPHCAVEFGVQRSLADRRKREGKVIHCPACGKPMGWGESEEDKLAKQLAAAKRETQRLQGTVTHLRDQRDAFERSNRGLRAAGTRLRKRVANGVCPCCKRTFADLGRHMAGQHPDFVHSGETS
jgi:hypothetical protein